MSYRKQISYLELQENGQRIRGAGYAKLESWEKEEILMVQLRGQGIVSGKEMLLYLQRESGEELLCEMTAERGTISCEKRIFRKADWEPTLGIRIPLERNFEIIGRLRWGKSKDRGKVETSRSRQSGRYRQNSRKPKIGRCSGSGCRSKAGKPVNRPKKWQKP